MKLNVVYIKNIHLLATRSEIKLRVVLPYFDNSECSRIYNRTISNEQICAGGVAGQDTCTGDSGGPLMTIATPGWTIVGIVSKGHAKCGLKNMPAIYTFVPAYLDWILNTITYLDEIASATV